MGYSASRRNERGVRRVSLLNAMANLFWTMLCVAPLALFCWRHVSPIWLYGSLALSALPCLVPRSALRVVELSNGFTAYRRMGVPLVNHVSQDGKLIRRVAGRNAMPTRIPDAAYLKQMERKSYTRERFHLAGAVFFLGISAVALQHELFGWAAYLVTANVVYNVYPVLLQQYVRLRLQRLSAKKSGRQ